MTGYTTGSLYVVNPTRNVTRLSSAAYFGICLSDRYIIATRKAAGTLLDVFERSNASLAFQISVGYDYNGCAVIGDQLYLLTDTAGMKSTNIANRAGATMKNWTIGTYRPGWTNMVVDSSGRFYTACSSCGLTTTCVGYPVCAMISESSNNTLLATFGDYWYLSGRASKYAYRFFASDYNTASVLLFEY